MTKAMSAMEERAQKQWAAAQEARAMMQDWYPEVCPCEHHSQARCIRQQLVKIAREHYNPLVTETMLWITYRDVLRAEGVWPHLYRTPKV